MTVPVQYGEHERFPPGTPCGMCAATDVPIMAEHCHAHGWVRGPACHSCNGAMTAVDRGQEPGQPFLERVPLAAMIEHAARCPDCPPIVTLEKNPPTKYSSILVRVEAANALRSAKFRLVGAAGRKVSMSDALVALASLSEQHQDELVRALRRKP